MVEHFFHFFMFRFILLYFTHFLFVVTLFFRMWDVQKKQINDICNKKKKKKNM